MATKEAKHKSAAHKKERSALSYILGDANAMGVWVFLSAVNEELGAMLSDALGIPAMTAGLTVLCTGLALYEPVCKLVGGEGASFNPSQNFAFAAAGKGSIAFHTLRSVAQTIGGSIGAAAALKMFPTAWQSKFGNYAHGVMPGVSIFQGFLAEALLSFVLNIVILWSMGTRYKSIGKLAPYIATVILVPLGSGLSGPFMNPAFAFSWFFNLRGAGLREHLVVFWGGCLSGSYLAGLVWYILSMGKSHARQKPVRSQVRVGARGDAVPPKEPSAPAAPTEGKKDA